MPRGDMIVLRRDTLANWAAAEVSGPALAAGERGYITDLNVDVVGDGAKKVAQLVPVGSGTYAPLSADWATGASYVVGQVVVNAGTVYRCTTAHTAGGSFAAGNFTSLGGGAGATVTIDADGTLVVNGTTVELGTDAEIAAAIAAAVAVKADDTAVVHKTGAETIAGVKTFSSSPLVPTPAVGDNSTQVATTAFVLANNAVNLGNASGDTTGATDYATIQAALTAARTAGGGRVVGKPGQTYLINETLKIGTGVELDMTGCTVRLVTGAGTKLMLANYSSLNPIATTGKAAVSNGATLWTLENTSDPAYVAINADAGKGAGWTFDIPATIGGVSVRFVGTIGTNGMNSATRQFNHTSGKTFPGTTLAYTAFNLYQRDSRIIVRGGIWDRQDNGTGDVETNHVMRWRGVDGITVRDVTFLSTVFNNGRYAMLVQNATSVRIDGVTYGLNPSQGLWSGTAGYARDGVHITGPTSNVIVRNVFGYPGDDMVAITASDYSGIAGNYWGHVTDVTIEDIRPTAAGQCAIKVMGGPQTDVKRILVRNVYGSSSGSAGFITIGDDNRQASTSNGVFDDITLENIGAQSTGGARPLVSIVAAQPIGLVTLRNLSWDLSGSTSAGVIAIGTNLYAAGAVATSIASLVVDNLSISAINAATKAVYVETGSSITSLACRGWRSPHTTVRLVGGPGTITTIRVSEQAMASLTRAARASAWYSSSPTNTTGDVFQVPTQDKLYLSLPRVAQENITIDQLAINTNIVGSAGAVVRLGIYVVNGEDPYAITLGSAWATLLVDAGTVATETGTGTKSITLGSAVTIGPGQAFTCGFAAQVAGPASMRIRTGANTVQLNPWGQASAFSGAPQVVSMSGVTAALPASFVPATFENMNAYSDNGVQFRRSA